MRLVFLLLELDTVKPFMRLAQPVNLAGYGDIFLTQPINIAALLAECLDLLRQELLLPLGIANSGANLGYPALYRTKCRFETGGNRAADGDGCREFFISHRLWAAPLSTR